MNERRRTLLLAAMAVSATTFGATTFSATTFGATYSTVRTPPVTEPLLELSVSPTLPACANATERCWATSPEVARLAVAPGEPFGLAFGCETPPVQGIVRVKFLYVATQSLVQDDCRTVGLTVDVGKPTPSLEVDYDGHEYTRSLPFDEWTAIELIAAEPAVYVKLERRAAPAP